MVVTRHIRSVSASSLILVISLCSKGLPGPPGQKGGEGNPGPKASLMWLEAVMMFEMFNLLSIFLSVNVGH